MDISTKREIPQSIYNIIKILKYAPYKMNIKGTASLASQQYYSDLDLFTDILEKEPSDITYKKYYDMVQKSESINDMYFIEFKVQNKKGDKVKYTHLNEFNEKEFNKIYKTVDFIKLDYVIRIGNKFIELSVNYFYDKNNNIKESDKSFQEITKSLKDDMNEQIKEGNYFKALKRLFSVYNLKYVKEQLKNTDKYISLSKFFNSEWGKLYSETANLKAIKLLLENYDDEETIKRAIINLKDLNIEPNLKKIDNIIKNNEKKYNNKAKELLSELNKK